MVYRYAQVKPFIYINSLGDLEPARFSDLAQVPLVLGVEARLSPASRSVVIGVQRGVGAPRLAMTA
jgi:hypothetical protein